MVMVQDSVSVRKARVLELKAQIIRERADVRTEESPRVAALDFTRWHLTFPPYTAPLRGYSPQEFAEFKDAVETADRELGALTVRATNLYLTGNVEDNIETYNRFGVGTQYAFPVLRGIQISWDTYALPTFFESPQLGRTVFFDFDWGAKTLDYIWDIKNCVAREKHSETRQLSFRIVHDKEGKIVPWYRMQGFFLKSSFPQMGDVLEARLRDLNPQEQLYLDNTRFGNVEVPDYLV